MEDNDKKIIEIEEKIRDLQQERDMLRYLIREEHMGTAKNTPEKFITWIEYGGPKDNYYNVVNIESKSGIQLFKYGAGPLFPERRQMFYINIIAEDLYEMLEKLKIVTEYRSRDPLYNPRGIMEQDIYDWMERLMELELQSIVYDW